ncbi:DUF3426 domain-containing protein [Arenimonas oryziterrae]|uniref:DUF3426 domain-containing protein n=1 Tax=Arenimonas oryziterrae DSM 21050 = YC6267 TaxID=1121015 RepID=A0A091ASU0_9GAMM|nr:DUF3426 domain-containing protein [Arenimonas oryziterrae]KFN42421.1 hypothetical protein N789_13780 [Arenimonas oryziterrae DSM 21050 = YC6267]
MSSPSPDFLQPSAPAPKAPGHRFWLWFALPWLVLALLIQIAVADRARFAADPLWRPRIQALCDFLRCELPAWHEPDAFHVTSREIRPHPSVPGVLLVSASFRNDAAFPQPWPQLELSLSNLDGDALGLRRFSPHEYLGSEPTTMQIASGQSASITLEVLDPGKRAVSFNFGFR